MLSQTPQITFEHIDVVVPGCSLRFDRPGVSANIPVVDTSEVTRVDWVFVVFMSRASCASDRLVARASPVRGPVAVTLRTDIYREEFLKHQASLEFWIAAPDYARQFSCYANPRLKQYKPNLRVAVSL